MSFISRTFLSLESALTNFIHASGQLSWKFAGCYLMTCIELLRKLIWIFFASFVTLVTNKKNSYAATLLYLHTLFGSTELGPHHRGSGCEDSMLRESSGCTIINSGGCAEIKKCECAEINKCECTEINNCGCAMLDGCSEAKIKSGGCAENKNFGISKILNLNELKKELQST